MDGDIMEARIANARAVIGPRLQALRMAGDERDAAIAYAALEELVAFDASLGWKNFLHEALSELLWGVKR